MRPRRLIFLYLAALLIAAKPADNSTSKPAALTTAPVVAPADRPCTSNVQQNHRSALCAAWVSADATVSAANWTMMSTIFSAASIVGLIITLLLTLRSIRISRETAERQLRAYVSVQVTGLIINQINKNYQLTFTLLSQNGGSTPAYNCNHFGAYTCMPEKDAEIAFANVRELENSSLKGGSVIHAGDDYISENFRGPPLSQKQVVDIQNGVLTLIIAGVCSYVDTFGIHRRTDFCQTITGLSFSEALGAARAAPERAVEVKWRIASYHNAAT